LVRETSELAAELSGRIGGIEGVSVSGGEPFQQPEALLDLLVRIESTGLSRLVFSGYTLAELERQPLGRSIRAHLDVLVAGRYAAGRHVGRALVGSDNQRIHLLTPRHTLAEFERIPQVEFILHADGTLTGTGIGPVRS
jgi:anaerobic ribonucleoside-triphosphate reductase activating protein